MSSLQLLILAITAMTALAWLRVVRVHHGRTAHPERRLAFFVAFLVVPPIALGVLVQPGADQLRGVAWVPLYAFMVAGLTAVMWVAGLIAEFVTVGRPRRLLTLALVGSEEDPWDVHDPPLTAKLAEGVAAVNRTNAAFPRGREFPAQVNRPGFRGAWDALDAATGALEGTIAEDARHGVAVASAATATAKDARSRLDTLRRLAVGRDRAWAG